MVGATEASLKKRKVPYRKSVGKRLRWPSYRRIGMKHAGYKILTGEDGGILGAHIISDNASGLINAFRQAIIDGKSVDDLYRHSIMTPYPSRESDIIYMLEDLITG
jgi:glutathione reductase (NADPH)